MSRAGGVFTVANRQRVRAVDARALEAVAEAFLGEFAETWEIGLTLVGEREMARINRAYLGHEGSTDVITFDHGSAGRRLHGELFVSVADAVRQGGEFGVPWTEELLRYVIHGALHLAGYDDLSPAPRRRMKQAEGRWVGRFRGEARRLAAPARGRRGGAVSKPAIRGDPERGGSAPSRRAAGRRGRSNGARPVRPR